MLTTTTPSSSPSSSSSWVSNLSPTLLIYLSFALTLFTHTVILNITAQGDQHASLHPHRLQSSSSSIPVPGGPEVHWDDIPAVRPHTPQPLQPATSPDAPLSDDDISHLSDASAYYPVNDDPVQCARVLGQLMSSRTEDDFFQSVPQTCVYMAYERFDERGRGHRKGESIHQDEEGEVVATLISA